MRVSRSAGGISVQAIAGGYSVLLGFDASEEARRGLLGFAIRRTSEGDHDERWLPNRRMFSGHERNRVTWPSSEAPVQKFRWGDYTAKPNHTYTYRVHPAYGCPGRVDLGEPVEVQVTTEDPGRLVHRDGTVHQAHFSRAAAASQAYIDKFGSRTPSDVGQRAFDWLSRGLLEALLAFVDSAAEGDRLRVLAYEIHHPPVLERLRAAVDRGVDLRVMYDAGTAKTAPTERNRQAIEAAGLAGHARPRTGLRSYISHHKFAVLERRQGPAAVWTGSTNMSLNGVYAQFNVGHVVEDPSIAAAYLALHDKLWNDDPSVAGTRAYLVGSQPSIRPERTAGTSVVFSPRSTEEAMEYYLELMSAAQHLVVITTPFGVDPRIDRIYSQPTSQVLKLGLTGQANRHGGVVRRLDSIDGTRYAMPARMPGSVLEHWQAEQWGLETHAYVHTKFMLVDALGPDPVLVTGSANFSRPSCVHNDEDMLVVFGHTGAADVYLTEFMRVFEHYALRQFFDRHPEHAGPGGLEGDDRWTEPYYKPGSERERDRLLFAGKAL